MINQIISTLKTEENVRELNKLYSDYISMYVKGFMALLILLITGLMVNISLSVYIKNMISEWPRVIVDS
jgi:hypothetical protein